MDWNAIRTEYEKSSITLKQLSEKHGVKLGTLKSRKSREKWGSSESKKDATKPRKVASAEPTIKNNKLTDKQKLFCMYYLKYFNATKAYQKAYECDYNTANANGSRALVNASVRAEIERLKQEQAQGVMLDARSVLQKYIDIAFADITDFAVFGKKEVEVMGMFGPLKDEKTGEVLKKQVNYVDFKESYEVDGQIITEVKQGKDGISVKLADKMKALDKLSEYLTLLPDSTKEKLQQEKLKVDTLKTQAEIEDIKQKNQAPENPDISSYVEALRGEMKDVFDDE